MKKVTMKYNYYSAATCAEVESKVTHLCLEQVSEDMFKHIDFRGDITLWSPASLNYSNCYVHKILIEEPSEAELNEERRRIDNILKELENKREYLKIYLESLDAVHS